MICRLVLVLLLTLLSSAAKADDHALSVALAGRTFLSASVGRGGALSVIEIVGSRAKRVALDGAKSVISLQQIHGITLMPMTKLLVIKNVPHLFFVDRSSRALTLAVKRGGQWLIERIGKGRQVANQFMVAACGSKLCASFYDIKANQTYLAEGSSRRWKVTPVPFSWGGLASSISASGNGDLAVVHFHPTDGATYLSLRGKNGSWRFESLPIGERSPSLQPLSAYDVSGTLYVALNSGGSGVSPRHSIVYLMRRDSDGSWRAGGAARGLLGSDTSFGLVGGIRPALFFQRMERSGGALRLTNELAELLPNGLWRRTSFPAQESAERMSIQTTKSQTFITAVGKHAFTTTLEDRNGSLLPVKEEERTVLR